MKMTREQLLDIIDKSTEPDVMPWEEAIEFLELLMDDLRVRKESLEEENE